MSVQRSPEFPGGVATPLRNPSRIPYTSVLGSCDKLPRAALVSWVEATLDCDGAAIVEGFPLGDNAALLEIARALGAPVTTGSEISGHPLEDGIVYRVEPRNGGRGIQDEDDLLIFSTTDATFDCHTDGYHNRESIDIVLMLCVRSDRTGGVTTLVHIDDIVDELGLYERQLLAARVFPTTRGPTAIIGQTSGRITVRFNLAEIERFHSAETNGLTEAHLAATRRLGFLAKNTCPRWRFLLQPGECLLLDNRRVLHGRSALSEGSPRLLKRVWVRIRDHQP